MKREQRKNDFGYYIPINDKFGKEPLDLSKVGFHLDGTSKSLRELLKIDGLQLTNRADKSNKELNAGKVPVCFFF